MKRLRGENEDEKAERESKKAANRLMLLSHGSTTYTHRNDHTAHPAVGGMFECTTCNRQFPSFQALGGHRSSHKRPRWIYDHHDRSNSLQPKARTHECSICGLKFAVGQALGGHMRQHRNTIDGYPEVLPLVKKSNNPTVSTIFHFDLNLTPLENAFMAKFGGSRFIRNIKVVH